MVVLGQKNLDTLRSGPLKAKVVKSLQRQSREPIAHYLELSIGLKLVRESKRQSPAPNEGQRATEEIEIRKQAGLRLPIPAAAVGFWTLIRRDEACGHPKTRFVKLVISSEESKRSQRQKNESVCFAPDNVFVVPAVDQGVYFAGRIATEQNSAFDAFAKKQIAGFRK